jgi:hypothetical protein
MQQQKTTKIDSSKESSEHKERIYFIELCRNSLRAIGVELFAA